MRGLSGRALLVRFMEHVYPSVSDGYLLLSNPNNEPAIVTWRGSELIDEMTAVLFLATSRS